MWREPAKWQQMEFKHNFFRAKQVTRVRKDTVFIVPVPFLFRNDLQKRFPVLFPNPGIKGLKLS